MPTQATIGGVDVDIIRGLPRALKTEVDVWRVPGLDGYGAQTMGKGNAEFTLTAILYVDTSSDDTDADTYIGDLLALCGTVVDIVDNFGNTAHNVLIQDIDDSDPKRAMLWTNGAGIRVQMKFKCVTASAGS
jgi:hypothetical protein